MIRLLTAVLFFASFNAVADVTLTPLSNNTPADANDVMGNFNALNNALPPSDCSIDQIIKWDGASWICSGETNQLCASGFADETACANGTYFYRYGPDTEAEWWGRANTHSCGESQDFFLYQLSSKWVLGTGLGGTQGLLATCGSEGFVETPDQCGLWKDVNGFEQSTASVALGRCEPGSALEIGCATNQIIKWSGNEWVCSTDVLSELDCDEGESIRVKNGSWSCYGTERIDAFAYARDWQGYQEGLFQSFDDVAGLLPNSYCDANLNSCFFYVAGVQDHATCSVRVHTGSAPSPTVEATPNRVVLSNMSNLVNQQTLHVFVSCLTDFS